MAGGIVVSKERGVSLGTFGFYRLIDEIRGGFEGSDASVMKAVFSPEDEGAMRFITALDLSAEDFQVFAKAVERAYRTCVNEGDFRVGEGIWLELLDAVRSDARYPQFW